MTGRPTHLEAINLEVEDGVAWVTLDRPDQANARNQRMRDELTATWSWIASSDDTRAMVLTGAGDRFFCAGMDLKEASGPEGPIERRQRLRAGRDVEQLAALPQPTIAAINGYALGGGLEMGLACDFRLMADTAEIGMPEVGHGLMPGAGGTQRLPAIVGYARAVEMVLLGDRLTAKEAVAIGLATSAVPASELHDHAGALARRLASQPTAAVRAAKESLRRSLEVPLSVGVDGELDGLLLLLAARDAVAPTASEASR